MIDTVEVLPPIDITTPVPASDGVGINALLAQAVQNNVNVEILERLLVIRRELQAEAAKLAFDEAMRSFQGECPTIPKTKHVKTESGAHYAYAPIEVLEGQTRALRNKYGFSYIIQTKTLDKYVRTTCIVKHIAGHQESSDFEVPIGAGTRIMSSSQVVAAAITFATRYAFRNAFGLITSDDDNEEVLHGSDKPVLATEGELATLFSLVETSGFTADAIAKKFKLDSFTNVPRSTCLYITTKLRELLAKRGGGSTNKTDEDEVIPGLND